MLTDPSFAVLAYEYGRITLHVQLYKCCILLVDFSFFFLGPINPLILVFVLLRYEREFFLNVVNGNGIISWGAVDTSRSDDRRDELIGFVTTRIIAAQDSEV